MKKINSPFYGTGDEEKWLSEPAPNTNECDRIVNKTLTNNDNNYMEELQRHGRKTRET